ncbi:MAG: DUF5696 domain-containing protein [Neobacillus sp.]
MVKKGLKYGVIPLIIAIVIFIYMFGNMNNVKYGIAVAQDDYHSIIVNDKVANCTQKSLGEEIPAQFKKVAENERLELFLEEESVAIAVKEKCSGYTWYSYDVHLDLQKEKYSQEMINYFKSGISMMTYDKFTPGRKTVLDQNVDKSYEIKKNGFEAAIDFKNLQIKFDLHVSLKGGDLIVSIPKESIDEYNPKLWKPGNKDISLNEIIVYPFLGSTSYKEDGYIVIPDGSGAIVNLAEKPKYTAGYTAPVYGKDMGYESNTTANKMGLAVKPLEKVSLPIYGVIHKENETGLLVISESGNSYATYNYRPKDSTTNYYQSFFTYNYRTTYAQFQSRVNEEQHILGFQKEPNSFDLVQRYVFLNNDDANYVGIAKNYRNFLEKKDGLEKGAASDIEKIPLKIDFINSEVKMGTLGMEDVTTTTYPQAKEIINSLLEKGYENVDVTFKTFIQKDLAYTFDVMRSLGGKEELQNTIEFFNANDVTFNHYVDYAQSYFEKTEYTASKLNRQDFSVYNVNKNLFNYMNNPKYFWTIGKENIQDLKDNNIQSVALAGFANKVFTHYDNGTIGSSTEGMEYIKQLMENLNNQGVQTSAYAPDAYMFKHLDNVYDTPIYSSELMFIDATIPLVPLVLSGYKEMYSPYMNFSANDEEEILRLIEYGVFPSFLLTGESTYKLKGTASNDIYVSELKYLENRVDTYYQTINQALKQVIGSEMVDHTIIDKGVIKVTYSNGKVILLNYNNSDYLYNDVQIKAKGFEIL